LEPYTLAEVQEVHFYKRDLLTSDLICCEITLQGGRLINIHEQMPDWEKEIERLSSLVGFDAGWFGKVSQPPFETCLTRAFVRSL